MNKERYNSTPELKEEELKVKMIRDYYDILESIERAMLEAPQLVPSYESHAARIKELYEERFGEELKNETVLE